MSHPVSRIRIPAAIAAAGATLASLGLASSSGAGAAAAVAVAGAVAPVTTASLPLSAPAVPGAVAGRAVVPAPLVAAPAPVVATVTVAKAARPAAPVGTGTLHPTTTTSSTTVAATPTTRTQPATTASTSTRHISFGLYSPGFPGSTAPIDTLAADAGRQPSVVMWYVHWGGPWSAFNSSDVQAILARGSTPMITWMTDDPTATSTVASLTPAAIAGGSDDAYIRSWAAGLRAIHGTVMLRLDHEMNGNWYSWSPGVNGTTAADYVAMWRHVHQVFAGAGVTNVRWVWSPNVEYTGSAPLAGLYPGNNMVDVVGLDGYNWGTSQPGKQWESFSQIFDASISAVHQVSSRPFMITEIATTDVGGDKAAWITDFLAQLVLRTDITGFVWFDADKETDWRFEETSATISAFSAGLLRFS